VFNPFLHHHNFGLSQGSVPMAKADFITGLIFMALGGAAFLGAWTMPRLEEQNVSPYNTPGLVPGFLGIIILVLGFALAVRSVMRGGHRISVSPKGVAQILGQSGNKRFAIALFLTVGYAGGLIGTVPFWLATGLFVFLFIFVFEWIAAGETANIVRLLIPATIEAVLVAGAVTIVFREVFLVTLP
jgi:hypothetical protein